MKPIFLVYPAEYGKTSVSAQDYRVVLDEYDLAQYAHGWNVLKVVSAIPQDVKLLVEDHV